MYCVQVSSRRILLPRHLPPLRPICLQNLLSTSPIRAHSCINPFELHILDPDCNPSEPLEADGQSETGGERCFLAKIISTAPRSNSRADPRIDICLKMPLENEQISRTCLPLHAKRHLDWKDKTPKPPLSSTRTKSHPTYVSAGTIKIAYVFKFGL